MSTKTFLDNLQLSIWFSQVGHGKTVFPQDDRDAIGFISSLEEAVSVWQADYENRCDIWETLRVQLLTNNLWEKTFNIVRTEAWNILHDSLFFTNIAREIEQQTKIEPEFFFSQLPIMGFWGEQLLNKEGSYSQQMTFFKKGVWVCGYDSKQWLIY